MKLPYVATVFPFQRLGFLDALRGFAALYVVLHHMSLVPKPPLQIPNWLSNFVSYGGSGVILFFVISGFSMCLTWHRHIVSGTPLKSFYISRLFRIAPLFYLWLVLTIFRDFAFKGHAGLHDLSEITTNIFFLFNFYGLFQTGIVWASWTIGVEMIFYLLFPIIIIYVSNSLLKSVIFLLGSIITVIFVHNIFKSMNLYFAVINSGIGFFEVFPAFLFGMVSYYLYKWINLSVNVKHYWRLSFLFAVFSLSGIAFMIYSRPVGYGWYYFSAASYSALLLAFSMLNFNPLVKSKSIYLGKVSYSLYLNHPNLIYILAPIYSHIYRSGLSIGESFFICFAFTLMLLIPISHITYKYIEEPFIRLGKKVLTS
jgi:peptidoglycan/LPS O-acetylase OafA/YrhL